MIGDKGGLGLVSQMSVLISSATSSILLRWVIWYASACKRNSYRKPIDQDFQVFDCNSRALIDLASCM